jgi:hypothetical protein
MTVGSRWFKFDFHNHTPASDDYRVPDLQPREWLLAYMRQQVDCVVISDHNSGAWIDVLKAELANMSRDASSGELADFRPLTLFPGWSSRPPATSISSQCCTPRAPVPRWNGSWPSATTTSLFRVKPPIISLCSAGTCGHHQ